MKIAIIGFGNIGRAVAEAISKRDFGLEIVGIGDIDGCIIKEKEKLNS